MAIVCHNTRQPPRLLEMVRTAIRVRGFSAATERSYVHWIRRYVRHHGLRHPRELDGGHIQDFLSFLAVEKGLAASTQSLALNAVAFLYREVLRADVGDFGAYARAKQPKRLPVVLSPDEVLRVLREMRGPSALVASLLYGSGLRLGEAVSLRVKDLDFDYRRITVRRGKDGRDRTTMLPDMLAPPLQDHLAFVRKMHRRDVAGGYGEAPSLMR